MVESFARQARPGLSTLAAAIAVALALGVGDSDAASLAVAPVTAQAATPSPALVATPAFHAAPVLLDAPDGDDAIDNGASARRAPHRQAIADEDATLPTRGLTAATLHARLAHARAEDATGSALGTSRTGGTLGTSGTPGTHGARATTAGVRPAVQAIVTTTFTPAQVRAAYGLPALPALGAPLSAAQRAQLGAGQTIYIVDAYHDANAATELRAFDDSFGLPACTAMSITPSTSLPLAAASRDAGCTFAVVYATAAGAVSAAAPARDEGWASEIALDVQWAHATAPLARLVLIETPNANIDTLANGIKLANRMGAGAVSMSFAAPEGNWTAARDAAFTAAGMSYFAASGDSGAGVTWPAVSTHVVGVGGTSLAWSGDGTPRYEAAWSGSAGGTSQYVATPSWQGSGVPGVGATSRRAVPDVAFNGNPTTGQYVAVIVPGRTTSWLSMGGTSLSTPQWAGLMAVANAMRVQAGQPPLTDPHAMLYATIGAVPGTYVSAFADIVDGSDGSCATCHAAAGFDTVTGLGTPNATGLLAAMTGSAQPAGGGVPPAVTSATASATAGLPFAITMGVARTHAVAWTLAGAPAGLAIDANGKITWTRPVTGQAVVTVTATDAVTGLAGSGTLTLSVAAAQPPVVTSTALTGVAGKALAGTITVTDPNHAALTVSITGAPSGMTVTPVASADTTVRRYTVSWARPVTGSWTLAVTANDAAGVTARAGVPVKITAK